MRFNQISKWTYIFIFICGLGLIGAGCFTTGYINGYFTPEMLSNEYLRSILNRLFLTIFFLWDSISLFHFWKLFHL